MAGTIVAIVGPSGAGKDSLMDFARAGLKGDDGFVFVRRVITRPYNAGGEAHEEVDEKEFVRRADDGDFALHWQAHGLFYAIPATTFDLLGLGKVLIVNGSRSALPAFREAYGGRLRVVLITAPREVLTARLALRGRENAESIRKRLDRDIDPEGFRADFTINNDGRLEDAGAQLLAYLAACRTRNDTETVA